MAEAQRKSGASGKKRDLELEENMPFHRRDWRAQRIGWGMMLLLLLAGVSGLLGHGLFSRRSETAQGLRVEYDGIGRYQSPSTLAIALGAAGDSTARLLIGREFIENVEVRSVEPEPESVEAGPLYYVFEFARASSDSLLVTFHYDPMSMGTEPLDIGVEGGSRLHLSQFYLP